MARLSGVDLPKEKHVLIGLTYIYGIGINISKLILEEAKIKHDTKVKDLVETQVVSLRSIIAKYMVEGDLLRKVKQDIKRVKDIGCYRGYRHKRNLPCRGQRTHTNARSRRGKKVAVAGKKKVTK